MKEKLNFKVNENDQLIINEIVIDLFHKSENYNHYRMEIKGYDKLIKFWSQLIRQATKTNFSANLKEEFSYVTIVTDDLEITFNCPKNELRNEYYLFTIDLKNNKK